jgi:hypothetical protein
MVKVTGGGRGMKAIAAHFRYISKNGRLDIEDDRGDTSRGKSALHGLADDWRYGGTFIDDTGRPARGLQHHAVDADVAPIRWRCNARRASSPRPSWRITST